MGKIGSWDIGPEKLNLQSYCMYNWHKWLASKLKQTYLIENYNLI